ICQLSGAPGIAYILWGRGWKWHDFSVRVTPRGVPQGVALAIIGFALSHAGFHLTSSVATASVPSAAAVIPAAPGVLVIGGMLFAAIVKAVFEALLVVAYDVQSLRGRFGIAL